MSKYVSLLRGINVSGQKKVRMEELRALYESLGFKSVATYIQSGNVVFESGEKNISKIKTAIEQAIKAWYGFLVPVELRTCGELGRIIDEFPFDPVDADANSTRYLVTFLSEPPDGHRGKTLMSSVRPPERLYIKGRETYLHCPGGYGKSKLSNAFLEARLGVCATTRNWKTVQKLFELSK